MLNTADTHENSDEFSLRVGFPPGLVGLEEVHMPAPILIKRRLRPDSVTRRALFHFRTAWRIQPYGKHTAHCENRGRGKRIKLNWCSDFAQTALFLPTRSTAPVWGASRSCFLPI